MKRVIISGGGIKSNRNTEIMAISTDGRRNVLVRWDSNTERKFYKDVLAIGTMCQPLIYKIVVIKPEPVILGDTKKAPKYYPDFLVQLADGEWQFVEVKGAIETRVWRKTMMILEDRILSGRLSSVNWMTQQTVWPSLMVARYIKKQWHYETFRRSA